MELEEDELRKLIVEAMTRREDMNMKTVTMEELHEFSKVKEIEPELFLYAEEVACEMNGEM